MSQIRAKEALKQQADMLRDEDLDNQLQMLDRLPDMIKILRSYPLPQNTLFSQNIRSTSATCADIFQLGTPNQGTSSPQSKVNVSQDLQPSKKPSLGDPRCLCYG